jgi:hypothetical protein
VPYLLGIGFGTSIALVGLSPESNPWFLSLLFLNYGISIVLITILSFRLVLRIFSLMKDETLIVNVDKRFLLTIVYTTILLFGGAIVDIIIFQYIIFADTGNLSDIFAIGGIITPIFVILTTLYVRKFFRDVEKADVVHIMNLLS